MITERSILELKKLPKEIVYIILDYYNDLWNISWFEKHNYSIIDECFFCNKRKKRRIKIQYEKH